MVAVNPRLNLSDCLESAIAELSTEQIYNHSAHDFKRSGDRLRGGCPFHQSQSKSSFVVTESSKLFWCEGCQVGGGPADYRASLQSGRWVKARQTDFKNAVRDLASEANIPFPDLETSPEQLEKLQQWERRRALIAATQEYCQQVLWSDQGVEARHYLIEERGLSEEKIKELPIGYYPSINQIRSVLETKGFTKEDWRGTGCVWSEMEGYITFLWSDANGRPLTIYGRYHQKHPPEGKPKTIALPGTGTKSSPLYLDRALAAGCKEVTLVEGVLDAVLLQANGDTSCCAYVAASCSEEQITTLKKKGIQKVVLCGDPDHGGTRGTNSNLLRLTEVGISVYVAPTLPDGLDPDEFLLKYGVDGWKAHLKSAQHGFKWKAESILKSNDLNSDAGKEAILREAIAYIESVPKVQNIFLKQFFFPTLANGLGISAEDLEIEIFDIKNRQWEQTSDGSDEEEDNHPEAFYQSVCLSKGLKFDNCVTAQTFDGWVYRQQFGAIEGDWRVLDSAFYQWMDKLGYWQHQPDNRINTLIANAGEKAFKLKHSKEFGWQIVKPYETNSYKESAFKYCRSRLENPEPLPANVHLRAFKNCVVDLRTGARIPHSKDFLLTNIIPYNYEPGKECPEVFRQFIADSFGEDMLPIIRAFTSMFLDPTAPYGRFPHLIGQSGGGKGTLGRLWNSLFGEDGASSGDFADVATAEGRHQYLTGKSIFAIPDAGGYVSGLRAFYELVDNGGMSGRALFNPVGYFKTWNCRFWVASVDHLQIENAGDGWARRAYPIPVKARRVKPDPDLRLKLEACKADVISWALAMSREERDRILLSPTENERVINLTLDSALYGDSTKSFVDLCLRPTAEATPVPHHLLHTWYAAYCREHGYTPLGMSKFISHLKTVLPRNFADRAWGPMVNGNRTRVPAHWAYLAPITGAFVKGDVEIENDPFRGRSEKSNPIWTCIKAACEEGGLMEFDDFWNSPSPPPDNGDNNVLSTSSILPASDSTPPQNEVKVVQGVQGGSDFGESLKQRNSGGVQGVQGVQGIGLEKNATATLERLEVEKVQATVTEGGHLESRVDSFNVEQSVSTNEVDAIVVTKQIEKRCNSKIGLWLLQINYLSSNQTQVTFESPAPESRLWGHTLGTTDSQEVKDYCLKWVSSLTDTILHDRSLQPAIDDVTSVCDTSKTDDIVHRNPRDLGLDFDTKWAVGELCSWEGQIWQITDLEDTTTAIYATLVNQLHPESPSRRVMTWFLKGVASC